MVRDVHKGRTASSDPAKDSTAHARIELRPLPPDESQTERLLTPLTLTGMHLGMLRRELNKDETGTWARAQMLVERLMQTHRSMIDEPRTPCRDEWPCAHWSFSRNYLLR